MKLMLAVVTLIGTAGAASADVLFSADFASPPSGWTLYGHEGAPEWSATGGVEGSGGLTATATPQTSDVWGFASPPLGSLSGAAYLSWSLRTDTVVESPSPGPDVEIVGPAGVLVNRALTLSANEWADVYLLRLDHLGRWRVGSLDGPLATPEQLHAVLADVTTIRFRAGYSQGATLEQSAIDNVQVSDCRAGWTWADVDCDGDVGTDRDIEVFFEGLSGNYTRVCGGFGHGVDVDGDGDSGTDADIEAFFRVLGGGCP
jgi:hypothetical protein